MEHSSTQNPCYKIFSFGQDVHPFSSCVNQSQSVGKSHSLVDELGVNPSGHVLKQASLLGAGYL